MPVREFDCLRLGTPISTPACRFQALIPDQSAYVEGRHVVKGEPNSRGQTSRNQGVPASSPPATVERPRQIVRSISSRIKCMLPSDKATLTPPVWALRAVRQP